MVLREEINSYQGTQYIMTLCNSIISKRLFDLFKITMCQFHYFVLATCIYMYKFPAILYACTFCTTCIAWSMHVHVHVCIINLKVFTYMHVHKYM